jgi:hypothetical protein
MLFTKQIDVFGTALESYRGCFSKPQWNHFKTYMHGLLLGEKDEKNIQDIAYNALDGRHRSSLQVSLVFQMAVPCNDRVHLIF